MKKVIYALIFLFVLAFIFKGFLMNIADYFGIEIPTTETIFVSTNGGETWSQKDTGNNNITGETIFFNESNPSEVFLASNKGVFKVEDKEITPKNIEVSKEINSGYISEFIQDYQRPNVVYLLLREVDKSKLLKSQNYGESFEIIFEINRGDRISIFKIDPVDPTTLYIGTKNGLFLVSKNSGTSWERKKSFSPQTIRGISTNAKNRDIYIALSSKIENFFSPAGPEQFDSRVLLSKDGGSSFSEIKKLRNKNIKKIESSLFTNNVYFISNYEIFLSHNNKISKLGLVAESKITAFTISPKNPNILYVGLGSVVYKTENNGKTWVNIETPERIGQIRNIKINPQNPNIILLTIGG